MGLLLFIILIASL